MVLQKPSQWLLRWSLKLQEFDFTPLYIKGEINAADGLSRQLGELETINAINKELDEDVKKKILTLNKLFYKFKFNISHQISSSKPIFSLT